MKKIPGTKNIFTLGEKAEIGVFLWYIKQVYFLHMNDVESDSSAESRHTDYNKGGISQGHSLITGTKHHGKRPNAPWTGGPHSLCLQSDAMQLSVRDASNQQDVFELNKEQRSEASSL